MCERLKSKRMKEILNLRGVEDFFLNFVNYSYAQRETFVAVDRNCKKIELVSYGWI